MFYGNRVQDMGKIKLPYSDKVIDTAKLIKWIVGMSNKRVMSGNMVAALNNILVGEVNQLEEAYLKYKDDPDFVRELEDLQRKYTGRPSLLYFAEKMTNDLGGATNHLLEDASGNTMIFRTSSYAKFAGKPVATGNGKVRGVLTKYGDDYQFSARYERDIILEGSRTQSIYTEDFQTSTNNTNLK